MTLYMYVYIYIYIYIYTNIILQYTMILYDITCNNIILYDIIYYTTLWYEAPHRGPDRHVHEARSSLCSRCLSGSFSCQYYSFTATHSFT